ncbi:MAG: response regulator [Deltaproteobacteria bacterium]|nr:response regulator [Deltaproteobacteria bacterium]
MRESLLNNKRVLAVDDEPDVLDTLREQLEGFPGLVLDGAMNYETGYHLLRSWTYDLVILDIMGVRGFDLLNASVSLGFPTVMLTAHVLTQEALERSIRMGARAYIPKEKMAEIIPFLEDVLSLSYRPGWKRVFERLGGFFNAKFGPVWQKKEKQFWESVASGEFEHEPVILKK